MGLRYDQNKIDGQKQDSTWASCSDLFMVLSFVFLLLYVVTTLKDTTTKVVNNINYQELERENKQLKREALTYNNLKEKHLREESSKKEQDEYKRLMSHLKMLQDNTEVENTDLNKKIRENQKRKQALNEYQRMIKSIIDANVLAKRKIASSKKVIVDQDQAIDATQKIISKKREVIEEKEKNIEKLGQNIDEQLAKIEQMSAQKKELNKDLKIQLFKYKRLEAQGKISKKKMLEEVDRITKENEQKVASMETEFSKAKSTLEESNKELDERNKELAKIKVANETKIQNQSNKISKLKSDLEGQKEILSTSREDFEIKKSQMLAEYQNNLNQSKNDFKTKLEQTQNDYKQKLNESKAEYQERIAKTEGAFQSKLKSQEGKYAQKLAQEKALKDKFKGDLEELKKIAAAKKALSNKLTSDLNAAGVKASVNSKTQEVEISFGEEYFDTGKFSLKNGMKKVVKKFMPTYAKSLFSNKELLKRVKSVEIIGFSSPTYKGKLINPSKITRENQKAINYNLDLSYYRARSIFQYAFNKKEINFKHQDQLLPYIKVTGRSFLQEGVKSRDVASSLSVGDYCKKYNCKKSQKVIVKFNME